MENLSYHEELKKIGREIIEESNKNIPDAVALKCLIDNMHIVIELIRRETIEKNKEAYLKAENKNN